MKKSMLLGITACIAATSLFGANLNAATVSAAPAAAHTYNFPARGDAHLGLTVSRPAVFEGHVASVDAVNKTITLQGNPDFDVNGFVTGEPHYALIKSGADEGMWMTITANTADTVTVALGPVDSFNNISVGEAIAVVPHWTIGSLFPDMPFETTLYFYRGRNGTINPATSHMYVHAEGNWYDWFDMTIGNNIIIEPGEGFFVRNYSYEPFSRTVTGVAPMAAHRTYLRNRLVNADDDRFLSLQTLVPVRLADASIPAKDWDAVYVVNNRTSLFNKASSDIFFYYDGIWYSMVTMNSAEDYAFLEPGMGYRYRRVGAPLPEAAAWQKKHSYLD